MAEKAPGTELLAAGLAVGLLLAVSNTLPLSIHLFAAAAAALVYGLDHTLDAPRRTPGLTLCALWFVIFVATFFYIPPASRPAVFIYSLLAIAYVLPVFPGRRRLQDFPALRVAAILVGWSCLPLLARVVPPLAWFPATALWLSAALLWSDYSDFPRDQIQRPTLSGAWNLPRLLLFSRCALLLSALLYAIGGLHAMALSPLVFLFAQETLGVRHPERFARYADLLLLLPLLLGIADLLLSDIGALP